jgi:ABC-2 type transport system permease protein
MDSLEACERNYKQYQQLAQPQISAIKTRVSLFPHQQTSQIQADYQLTNTTDENIKEIFITSPKALQKISLKGAKLTLQDSDENWHVYLFPLKKPLLPGQ